MAWDKKIPFCDGNMLHYEGDAGYITFDSGHVRRKPIEWREQEQLLLILTFKKMHHGRSAVYGTFEDTAGHTYPVSLNVIAEHFCEFKGGTLDGYWLPKKKGNNYLLDYVRPRSV